MNYAKDFLHSHSRLEFTYLTPGLPTLELYDHIVVDKKDWQATIGWKGTPSLPVRFHKWMLENDTEENAERWANYSDEDMFYAFLKEQNLAL